MPTVGVCAKMSEEDLKRFKAEGQWLVFEDMSGMNDSSKYLVLLELVPPP